MGSGDLQGCGRVALECWEGLGQEERRLQGRWTGECGAESSPILKIPIVGNCSKISGGWQFGRNTKRSLLSDTTEILSGAFGSGAVLQGHGGSVLPRAVSNSVSCLQLRHSGFPEERGSMSAHPTSTLPFALGVSMAVGAGAAALVLPAVSVEGKSPLRQQFVSIGALG